MKHAPPTVYCSRIEGWGWGSLEWIERAVLSVEALLRAAQHHSTFEHYNVSCRACLVNKEEIGRSTFLLFSCRYWGLGFHNCRFGYHTIDIVEEVVANYSAAMVGRGRFTLYSITLQQCIHMYKSANVYTYSRTYCMYVCMHGCMWCSLKQLHARPTL